MKLKKLFVAVVALAGTIGSMFADEPFRLHRYDSFKACEVNENSIVFIGNSITNMGEWWEFFGSNPNVVNRGNSGCYSYESLDQLESILIGRPAKIFVMVGTNDIGGATGTPETVAANARQMIDRIQAESPNTEIYITSVFPSTNGLRNLTNLGQINSLLQPLCEEKGVTYVDLWNDLMGIVNGGGLSLDALHVNPLGYRIWCEKVAPYVGSESVFTDGNMTLNSGSQSYSYAMRSQQFGCLPVKSTDVLIVGDEMIHGGEWHELLHCDRVKGRGTVWGYGGITIAAHISMLESTLSTNPDIKEQPAQIYFYVGLNPLNNSATTVETMATDYQSLIAKAKELAPNSELFIMGLTPHANATYDTKTKSFNEKLQEIAANNGCTYVDTYTPLTTADGSRDAELVNGNSYITAKGYIRLAQTLAPYIGDDAWALTDEQFQEHYDMINAREAIGRGIIAANNLTVGTTTGTYTAEGVAPLLNKIEEALALLAKDGVTIEELQTAATEIDELTTTAKKALNQPVEGKWYTMQTPNRNSKYLTANANGSLIGGDESVLKGAQWRFELRDDGTFNVVNRLTGTYLAPNSASGTALSTSTTIPSAGWELSPCGTLSLYIITSGTCQLNQTNTGLGSVIYNWGYGSNVDGEFNTTDAGCLYSITELADDAAALDAIIAEPTPSTAKVTYWHTMKTPLREARYVTETGGALWGETTADTEASQWKIVSREDGTYDLVNRATGNYILPTASYNTQLATGSESPAAGWEFKAADTTGYYIIVSGTAEFNQTNSSLSYKVYNWGSATNTSDAGCQYLFSVIDQEEEPESGINTIVVSDEAAADSQLYDIQGRKVERSAVRPGLYICNRKKIVVR